MSLLKSKLAAPKLQSKLKSVLLIDVIQGYTEGWMHMIEEATGKSLEGALECLPDAIQMRLVSCIEISFTKNDQYKGFVRFNYDWDEYKLEIHRNGEKITLDSASSGNLTQSMEKTIEECGQLIKDIWKTTKSNRIHCLYWYDSTAIERYGEDGINRRLKTRAMTEEEAKRYQDATVTSSYEFLDPNTKAMRPAVGFYR